MIRNNLCSLSLFLAAFASAGAATTASGSIAIGKHGNFAIENYEEPADQEQPDPKEWQTLRKGLHASWASRDVHYRQHRLPRIDIRKDTAIYVWRGERANMEALLFSPVDQGKLCVRMTEWRKQGDPQAKGAPAQARFMNYVMTDGYKTCGYNPMTSATYLVPDVIDRDVPHHLRAMEVRPVWCTLEIPYDAEPGRYDLGLEITNADTGTLVETLNLAVNVRPHTLPRPSEQQFHLDFWQQPYAISRYYGTDIYSPEHLAALRPYLKMLARAGQRVATTILFYEPWGVQSHDKFEPMVETTLNVRGEWEYRFDRFDAYVELCEECGIDRQINCYSMIPWEMKFRYYDAKSQTYQYIAAEHNTAAYRELWTNFLEAFGKHLKEKGWFDKTCLAMDERGLEAMKSAHDIAQKTLPGIKMALAGVKHADFATVLYDYSIALDETFTPEELAERKAKGFVTTAYSCCSEPQPNLFTNSLPAEATFLPIFCLANGLDGYLHWSWMNWHDTPLTDSRFRMFAPGDTYCIYPGERSSVRFERFIEGIQHYEKILILRDNYKKKGESKRLEAIETAVERFKTRDILESETAAALVNHLEALLNDAPAPQTVGAKR